MIPGMLSQNVLYDRGLDRLSGALSRMNAQGTITRLAPSPTGALHLGNVRTFVLNSLLARAGSWRMLLRVEDLDGPRVKAGAAEAMIDELRWLGLAWEEPAVWQSRRLAVYRAACRRLVQAGWAYPCACSRRDVQAAASAPHGADAAVYPGTCRAKPRPEDFAAAPAAWRIRVEDREIAVPEEFAGPRAYDLSRTCGDFVIWTRQGEPAYQLAVVVDDAEAGVDAVVRGDDLLESGARQMHLRRLLGIDRPVRYWHLPLVIGPDGKRLAKRHGDTRLGRYRSAGATRQRVLGLAGFWSGLIEKRRETDWDELARRFDLARVPKTPVVFCREDEKFLVG
jgi:glutamyl-tRNA synthetase